MSLMSARDRQLIGERLKEMADAVKLINFTQELECPGCRETSQLLRELSELSDKLTLEVYNFQLDREKVDEYKIDKIPATAIVGAKDVGIRFYGFPGGYEFASLLEAILSVSKGQSGLQPASVEKLRAITRPVHLEVLVTPT
jgi:glutaredoxin-like protein